MFTTSIVDDENPVIFSLNSDSDSNEPRFSALFKANIFLVLCVYVPISAYYVHKLWQYRRHIVLVKRYIKLTFHQIFFLISLFIIATIITILYVLNIPIAMYIWIIFGSINLWLAFGLTWVVTWRFWYVCIHYIHIYNLFKI